MKTRQTTTLTPTRVVAVTYTPHGGATCAGDGIHKGYDSFYEIISEDDHGVDLDNTCWHYKRVAHESTDEVHYSSGPNSTVYCEARHNYPGLRWRALMPSFDSAPYGEYGTHGYQRVFQPGFDVNLNRFGTYFGDYEFGPLIQQSIDAMLPGIKDDLSIVNSLYELKDLKRLPGLIQRSRQFISSFPSRVRSGRHRHTLKKMFKMSGDSYLSNEFGIRPLLSDITSIYSSLTSARKQLEKLLRNEGKRRRSYFVRTVPELIPAVDESFVNSASAYGGDKHRRIISSEGGEPKFTAVMEYQYFLDAHQKANAELLALFDVLGYNLNPAIIWNAIPWSFVIDWFLGIGQWLDRFKRRNLEPTTHIHRYCWSIKGHRRIMMFTHQNMDGPIPTSEVPIRTSDEYFYYRSPHQPDWFHSISSSGMNLKEFSYIGALTAARLRL